MLYSLALVVSLFVVVCVKTAEKAGGGGGQLLGPEKWVLWWLDWKRGRVRGSCGICSSRRRGPPSARPAPPRQPAVCKKKAGGGTRSAQTQPENNCLGIIVILGFNTIQQEKWEFKHLTASKQPAGNNGNQTSYSSVSADYMSIAVFRSSCCNVDN